MKTVHLSTLAGALAGVSRPGRHPGRMDAPRADVFIPKLFDLLQNGARPWAYPFAGRAPGPKPKLEATAGASSWDDAMDRKRLQWLVQRRPRHEAPPPVPVGGSCGRVALPPVQE